MRESIKDEFSKMNKKKVWQHKSKQDITPGCTLVASHWVIHYQERKYIPYEIGCRRIHTDLGVNHMENSAWVNSFDLMVFDAETSLLYRNLKEKFL